MVPESVKKADTLARRLEMLEMKLEMDIDKQNKALALIVSDVGLIWKQSLTRI